MFTINEEYNSEDVVKAKYTPMSSMKLHFDGETVSKSSKANLPAKQLTSDSDSKLLEKMFIISLVLTMQLALGTSEYSGYNKPPMHGDYEAQRHWMEITYHLPIREWYIPSSQNDLQYWGLDYPPLTAYHSWLMGAVSHRINSSWVALESSHGIETPEHKLFMRLTAIIPFISIYLPAILSFAYNEGKLNSVSPIVTSLLMLLYPGLLAMDNAHFQYNSISLGLFLWAYLSLSRDKTFTGSLCFVLAVNYKQMELYHSLPVFVFILARSLKKPFLSRIHHSIFSLIQVGGVVLVSFAIIWSPFVALGKDDVLAVLGRIFPFYRGLFEDKVASVWCAFSWLIKFNRIFSVDTQLRLSTLCVLIFAIPSLLVLFVRPSSRNLRLSLLAVSTGFFCFSFQVHEKSILLPAISALILIPEYPSIMCWFLNISSTSMFSLCIKDGNPHLLGIFFVFYLATAILFAPDCRKVALLQNVSTLGAFLICLCELTLAPPAGLPHLFPLLNAFYSCCHFLALLMYINCVIVSDELHKRKTKKD